MRTSAALLGRLLTGEALDARIDLAAAGVDSAAAGVDSAAAGGGYPDWPHDELSRLLERVPLTESVFRHTDPDVLRARYATAGFIPTGPAGDHLGDQLRFLATLDDDDARDFVGSHLGPWVDAALDALEAEAGETRLSALFDAVRALLADEVDRLRPASDPVTIDEPAVGSADELVDHLLDPRRCGGWISSVTVGEVADELGLGPVTERGELRTLARGFESRGELATLASLFRSPVEGWVETWVARQWVRPLGAPLFRPWKTRAQATLKLLNDISAGTPDDRSTVRLTVAGGPAQVQTSVEAVRTLLVAQGLDVTVDWGAH